MTMTDAEHGTSTADDGWLIYSCDDHLDLRTLPPDLWTSRVSAALRDEMPHVVHDDTGSHWFVRDKSLGPSGSAAEQGGSAIDRAGIDDDGFRASTPELRLADMELDGVHASVIYGPNLWGLPIEDPELKTTAWRVWNDWSAEFNAHAPGRLAALAVVPTPSPDVAVSELERIKSIGHRGAMLYAFEIEPGDRAWDPLWAAAADTGLPISFHIGGGVHSIVPRFGSWEVAAYSSVVPMQLDELLAQMIFSGALERHPGFKLVLAESGAGWIPYLVERMDGAHRKYRGKLGGHELTMTPSEIFRRQVWATFEEEPAASVIIPLLGADCFMWASDYPHLDSTFPHSRRAIDEALGSFSTEDRRKITADNCRELYGFE